MAKFIFSSHAYVYVMADMQGRHKIGISHDPILRVYQIKKSENIDINLKRWDAFAREESIEIERLAHYFLLHCRDHPKTDWFFASESEAFAAVDRAIAAYRAGERVPSSKEQLAAAAAAAKEARAARDLRPKEKMARLSFELSLESIKKIDDWRARQSRIPNRSEAIRYFLAMALELAETDAGKMIDFQSRVKTLKRGKA